MGYLRQALHTEFAASYDDPVAYHNYAQGRGRDLIARHVASVIVGEVGGPDPTVLELAAGTGILSSCLRGAGLSVTATDADSNMIDFMTERLPDVETELLDFNEPFPFADSSFDAVTTLWANRYLSRGGTNNFVQEAHRVLRPDGVLVWPFFVADHWLWRSRAGLTQTTTMKGMAKRLANVGYTNVHIDKGHKRTAPDNGRLYPAYLLARKDPRAT
jgi:ubiquinone/menaquinone biosynthesis C-methylase UbiE